MTSMAGSTSHSAQDRSKLPDHKLWTMLPYNQYGEFTPHSDLWALLSCTVNQSEDNLGELSFWFDPDLASFFFFFQTFLLSL